LRHGLLYYHYHIRQIPLQGPGRDENGLINHIFFLTPVGVHEGWVEGVERTITSVSGNYTWKHQAPPKIYLFDLDGNQIEHQIESVKMAGACQST
jgi:hypothetical protein